MKKLKFKAKYLAPVLLVLMMNLFIATPAHAQGIGLTGNFYKQHFEMSPGETSPSEGVYVIVSNSGDDDIRVKMNTISPEGVTFLLSDDEFVLDGGTNQKVGVGLEVSPQATPGEYKLTISAEAYSEGTGIKVTSGAQQQAALSILGESGQVTIKTVSEDKNPLSALIGIFQENNGEVTELRSGRQTQLRARLVPGTYLTQARIQNIKVAEESFSLSTDEEKVITLVCYTLCVSDFSVSPIYSDDEKLTSSKIEYTIANLEKQVNDFKAILNVLLDGKSLDETELLSTSILDVGSRDGSYNYIPAQGWQKDHKYSFNIELYSGDKLRYQSPAYDLISGQELVENQPSTKTTMTIKWPVIAAIVGGVIIIILLILFFVRRRAY